MKKKIIYIFLTVLWMVFIFWLSNKPADESSKQSMFITEKIIRFFMDNPPRLLLDAAESIVRKLAHFTEYFILAFLVYKSIKQFKKS